MGTKPPNTGDSANHSIAIIGMACEFPGAHSPEELWQNILAGRRFFRKAPVERLPREYFDSDPLAPGKSYCDQMAVIEGWQFDPVEFRIPPVAFHASDLAHWLALYTARIAIRDAGLNLQAIDRARMGVVLGNTLTGEFSRSHNLRHRWPYVERAVRRVLARGGLATDQLDTLLAAIRESYESPLPEITEDSLAGNMANTIAGRICGYFDLGAGGYTVDGACSSSLLSVAHACNALLNGEMDFALAGGVDISLDPFEIVGFAKAQALAREDIRPYDERAAGMLAGEGCGIFVLMREADARVAGHRIHALVRGWGISSDGAGGITAPEIEGQMRTLRNAYERAGYPISSVGLIEGHGTGTTLGDKVEITAIRRLLEAESGNGVCRIGSIKANIGHCKAAAGAAGLTKAIMALKRKVLPPTVNCDNPNPVFGKPLVRLRPSIPGQAWDAKGQPRRASVSSMGFGGANSHVTLEEVNPTDAPSPEDLALLGSAQSSELILLSAASVEQLRRRIAQLLPIAERLCRAELTDLSAALAKQTTAGESRVAIVAESPWHLADALRLVLERLSQSGDVSSADAAVNGIFAGKAMSNPGFVALFPGQGSQRLNMGEHLLRRYPFAREFYEQASSGLKSSIFRDTLAADEATTKRWESELRDTETAQPAIVLSSVAMLRVLEFLGLKPTVSIGHSLGEITALHAAGAFAAATAVRLAALRGQAMSSLQIPDPGAMLAISAKPEDVQSLVAPFASSLVISNYNSLRQTVVSGATESVARLRQVCADRNIRCQTLAVSHAFHSDIVAPAAAAFRSTLESTTLQQLAGRVISTSTGDEIAANTDLKELLAQQIRRPVRFLDAVRKAAALRPALWIEVGPGGVLTSFVRDILGAEAAHCLPTDLAGDDGFHLLNQVLARAFVLGFPVATDRLFAHRFHRPFDAENYHPVFIVNPCERPVELTMPVEPLALAGNGSGGNEFLREFAELYQKHHVGDESRSSRREEALTSILHSALHNPRSSESLVTSAATETKDAANDKDSLLTFAIDWIAKRTGFPKSAIAPDKRLRDDLNLDSIKVGELVVLMTRKAKRSPKGDPTALANATLTQLVEALLREEIQPAGQSAASEARRVELQPTESLGEWTRTFCMAHAPAPIESETARPLRTNGTAIIVAAVTSPHVAAIADALREKGLSPLISNASSLTQGDVPRDLAVLVLVLPSVDKGFLGCSPAEFNDRVEGLATQLFRVFRWALATHSTDDPPLCGLVFRPVADNADASADLDAGAGFLKSVLLESPDADFKWVSLPAHWSPDRWAELAVREMEHSGRMAVAYSADGQRTADVAHPIAPAATSAPLALGPEDVVLVSGGGKGITFELAYELARAKHCKLALLGSSPLPAGDDANQDELPRNLARLKREGIAHVYVKADVTDMEAVRRAVTEAERRLGRITGIFHGAGITQLRSFRDKSLDDFLHCIRIKARGLYNLLTAVPPARLKMLHVTSSVLGNTGMRGQTDYTFANAWLDEAVRSVKAAHPHIHCLSLGYSVWAETGLGKKIGALESLRAVGVTPVSVKEGVSAYRHLLDAPQTGSKFVITGRLTSDLEANLYPRPLPPRGRFRETVRRWIPGTEIVADANVSHATDLYLPEHVFEGTPMFPGVMAIEAMVQAAMACAGRDDLPVLRNIAFRRPLIVPEDATVVVRTLALSEPAEGETICVRAAMRSNGDDFQQNHFEAECWFGLPAPALESLPVCPSLPEPLDKDPETLSPVPLFQGKFFRRIAAIRRQEMEKESLTDLELPADEAYFNSASSQPIVTQSPALRDAMLQSSAVILPPGCLPVSIRELRFIRRHDSGSLVRCHVLVMPKSPTSFVADIAVFDESGALVEMLRDMLLQLPAAGVRISPSRAVEPISLSRVPTDLRSLLPRQRHALAFAAHNKTNGESSEPTPREMSLLANTTAMRSALVGFCTNQLHGEFEPSKVELSHRSDGKPELQFADVETARWLNGTDISLADMDGLSVALLGHGRVGVDVERVISRNAEMWRGLLGADGYALALRLSRDVGEPFDQAATRIWALIEAGKKSNGLKRVLPQFSGSVGGPWLSFTGSSQVEYLCCVFEPQADAKTSAVLAVVFGQQGKERPE